MHLSGIKKLKSIFIELNFQLFTSVLKGIKLKNQPVSAVAELRVKTG
jgi:hypothetical protein